MPIYVYAEVLEDGSRGEPFEVSQRIQHEALKVHPTTGRPVVRLLQPPLLRAGGKISGDPAKAPADALAAKGFTRYERSGDDTWSRTAGTGGPTTLHKSGTIKE